MLAMLKGSRKSFGIVLIGELEVLVILKGGAQHNKFSPFKKWGAKVFALS